MDNPDTSSAEWIAEAPSATADGHADSISDFNATPRRLQPGVGGGIGGGQFRGGFGDGSTDSTSPASVSPSTLTSDRAGFTVAWQAPTTKSRPRRPTTAAATARTRATARTPTPG